METINEKAKENIINEIEQEIVNIFTGSYLSGGSPDSAMVKTLAGRIYKKFIDTTADEIRYEEYEKKVHEFRMGLLKKAMDELAGEGTVYIRSALDLLGNNAF